MATDRKCLGFPDGKVCDQKAGTLWTPHWCSTCDALRRDHISKQLHSIQQQLKERTDGN